MGDGYSSGNVQLERTVRPREWIVELYGGLYLAPGHGYPGRTFVRDSAKRYKTEHAAKCALAWTKRVLPSLDYSKSRVIVA